MIVQQTVRRLWTILCLLLPLTNALHFYLDASERRCFIEELPTDTVVEGKSVLHLEQLQESLLPIPGHYRALEWSEQEQKYAEMSNLGMDVEVDVSSLFRPTS